MSTPSLMVLIPALKKTVAFQDDLVKKLAGVSLILRAIDKAIELGIARNDVHVLTDSDEIRLIAERNGVSCYWNPVLVWNGQLFGEEVGDYLKQAAKEKDYALLLSPYAPLLTTELIEDSIGALVESSKDLLKPVSVVQRHHYDGNDQTAFQALFGSKHESVTIESKAFVLFRSEMLRRGIDQKIDIILQPIGQEVMEIESYRDWWVCEKLLTRKRIVFRVIGSKEVGMGHIYRSLSLAHEITDHEILFVTDNTNAVAVSKLAGYDYWLGTYETSKVIENIIQLKPDLVVNDVLSTTKEDVLSLQREGIKVANFEDFGDGARLTDLTINEFYDKPKFAGGNILWGHQYFFVRDEFHDARPNQFKTKVDTIMLAFGGTDQHDLASKVHHAICEFCKSRKILVHIVAGEGYTGYKKLQSEIRDNNLVTLTKATGVISSIMEQSQLAIVSNGRTVYELAHMNIPAIVISQHEREATHSFACEENGFISIGTVENRHIDTAAAEALEKLIDDTPYRRRLFGRTKKYRFSANKKKVLNYLLALLPEPGERRTD